MLLKSTNICDLNRVFQKIVLKSTSTKRLQRFHIVSKGDYNITRSSFKIERVKECFLRPEVRVLYGTQPLRACKFMTGGNGLLGCVRWKQRRDGRSGREGQQSATPALKPTNRPKLCLLQF